MQVNRDCNHSQCLKVFFKTLLKEKKICNYIGGEREI